MAATRQGPLAWATALLVLCATVAGAYAADNDKAPLPPKKLLSAADKAFRKKDFGTALNYYAQLLAVEPSAKHYYKRYKVHQKMQNYERGVADLNEAISIDPKFTTAYLQRANTQVLLGDCAAAVTDYRMVLKLDPKKKDAQKRLPDADKCASHVQHARRQIQARNFKDAVLHLTEAIDKTRAGLSPVLLLLRAEANIGQGHYEEAIADSGKVLKKQKNNMQAYLTRGQAHYMLGEHDMAKRHAQEGLRMDPEHAGCKELYRLVRKLNKLDEQAASDEKHGRYEASIKLLDEAVALDPRHRPFLNGLRLRTARLYNKLKDYAAAEEAARLLVAADDEHVEGHMELGRALGMQEKYEEAVREWKRAHDLNPNAHEVREGLQRAEADLKRSKQKDYYKILGVPKDANDRQIKKAFRKKALVMHPDKVPDAEKEDAAKAFQEVGEAYEILSDAELRAKYDRGEDVLGNQGQQGGGRHFRHGFPGGFPGGGNFHFKFG